MDFNIDKEIYFLEETIDNIKKTGSSGSLMSLIPVSFNYIFRVFRVLLFLLRKEKEREK